MTSSGTASAASGRLAAASTSRVVSAAASRSMSATATHAPSSAKRMAVARPMPLPPPVTRQTRSARRSLIGRASAARTSRQSRNGRSRVASATGTRWTAHPCSACWRPTDGLDDNHRLAVRQCGRPLSREHRLGRRVDPGPPIAALPGTLRRPPGPSSPRRSSGWQGGGRACGGRRRGRRDVRHRRGP